MRLRKKELFEISLLTLSKFMIHSSHQQKGECNMNIFVIVCVGGIGGIRFNLKHYFD